MGVELLDTAPLFAGQMNACAEAFAEFVDWSLIDVLRGAPGAPSLDRVDVVQPALFAVMVSLAELWRSIGVRPDAVIGHSKARSPRPTSPVALSLRDAARVVTLRRQTAVGAVRPRRDGLLGMWNRSSARAVGAVWRSGQHRRDQRAISGSCSPVRWPHPRRDRRPVRRA